MTKNKPECGRYWGTSVQTWEVWWRGRFPPAGTSADFEWEGACRSQLSTLWSLLRKLAQWRLVRFSLCLVDWSSWMSLLSWVCLVGFLDLLSVHFLIMNHRKKWYLSLYKFRLYKDPPRVLTRTLQSATATARLLCPFLLETDDIAASFSASCCETKYWDQTFNH